MINMVQHHHKSWDAADNNDKFNHDNHNDNYQNTLNNDLKLLLAIIKFGFLILLSPILAGFSLILESGLKCNFIKSF